LDFTQLDPINPALSNKGEVMPGIPLKWSCGLLLNMKNVAEARSALSGGWAGIANSYYFIDPTLGVSVMYSTQVLPFLDGPAATACGALEHIVCQAQSKL